ncbi:MAG: helix-turn-helix domain-containing protein [Micrococcales bacterium]|nr:helix-turn-helix domain-containing protein [Micrococcales bacterium]
MDDRLLYRVPEVARFLSLSRSKVYVLMQSGALPSVRIDGSRRVRGKDLREFVDSLLPRVS